MADRVAATFIVKCSFLSLLCVIEPTHPGTSALFPLPPKSVQPVTDKREGRRRIAKADQGDPRIHTVPLRDLGQLFLGWRLPGLHQRSPWPGGIQG